MSAPEPPVWYALSALAVGVLLACEYRNARPALGIAKLTASTAFVGVAVTLGAMDSLVGQVVLTGLILCWLGDALLIPAGQSLSFQLGIAAFLLGHVAYAVAFLHWAIDRGALLGAVLLMSLCGGLALRWLRPKVPEDFQVPVVAYILVIGAMCACAISATSAGAPFHVAGGALLFAASDLSVARDRFVQPSFLNAAWGLPAYFAAQMILASSIRAL